MKNDNSNFFPLFWVQIYIWKTFPFIGDYLVANQMSNLNLLQSARCSRCSPLNSGNRKIRSMRRQCNIYIFFFLAPQISAETLFCDAIVSVTSAARVFNGQDHVGKTSQVRCCAENNFKMRAEQGIDIWSGKVYLEIALAACYCHVWHQQVSMRLAWFCLPDSIHVNQKALEAEKIPPACFNFFFTRGFVSD